jgi:formylglycine-generating enzyme required for sulfatase activity
MTAASVENRLSSLVFSAGTLIASFSSDTTSYYLNTNYTVTSVNITPTLIDTIATMTVDGSSAASGSPVSVGISNGKTILIVVTAQSGATRTYSVTVTMSSVCTLASLSFSAGTLSPSFASGTTTYSLGVSSSTSSVDVTPVLTDAASWMTLNSSSVLSGSSNTVAVTDGSTITIIVTAQDSSVMTYTVTVAYVVSESQTGAVLSYTLPLGESLILKQTTPDSVGSGIVIPVGITSDGLYAGTSSDYAETAIITTPFYIGETEVSLALWNKVRVWSSSNGNPFFYNEYGEGTGDNYPVINVNWRTVIVWCNALTKYYNDHRPSGSAALTYVYYYNDGNIATNCSDGASIDAGYRVESNTGFRLPSSIEWEFAARYLSSSVNDCISGGSFTTGYYWIPGSWVSGMTSSADVWSLFARAENDVQEIRKTTPNPLGLYDMCGNAAEWCSDYVKDSTSNRYVRGGSYQNGSEEIKVGYGYNNQVGSDQGNAKTFIGFRIAKTK